MTQHQDGAGRPHGQDPATAGEPLPGGTPRRYALDSLAVSAGRPHGAGEPVNVPLVLTSTYVADGPVGYAREGTPTWTALEEALGALEDAHALALSSGMGAVACVLDLVPTGGVVVAPDHPYSGTAARLRSLQEAGRLTVRWVSMADTAAITAALPGADLAWLESPTNPLMEVADLASVATVARREGVRTVADNTFATPVLQRPLDLGIDITMQSGTKYIGGHSDLLLGVLATRDEETLGLLRARRTLMGLNVGSIEAWLALRGLRTLPLRMRAASANAAEIARRLNGHPRVRSVLHPSLPTHPQHEIAMRQMGGNGGAIVSVVLEGSARDAEDVCAATRLWTHATSLGGVESTLERRGRWPAESPDVPESLLRLSVGIEDVEDLWTDLTHALG